MLAVAACFVAFPNGALGASAPRAPLLTLQERSWTFRQLGYGTDTYLPGRGFRLPHLPYRLPVDVHQGVNGWWLLHLHIRIEFDLSGPLNQSAYIAAAADQVGCAYIRLDATKRHGAPAVVLTTSGIVDGITRTVSTSRQLDIWYANYLPFPSIRPGLNVLQLIVRAAPMLRRIVVLPDSSLEHTALSPARIAISVRVTPSRVIVGREAHVAVTIHNNGLRAAKRIAVSLDLPSGTISIDGARIRRLALLRHGSKRQLEFVVRAHRIGSLPFGVSAVSSSNQTAAVARLQAVAAPPRRNEWLDVLMSVGAAIFLGAAVFVGSCQPARGVIVSAAILAIGVFAFWAGVIGAVLPASLLCSFASGAAILAINKRWKGRSSRLRQSGVVAIAAAVVVLANLVLLVVLAALGGD